MNDDNKKEDFSAPRQAASVEMTSNDSVIPSDTTTVIPSAVEESSPESLEKAPLSKGATREQVAQCATCSQSGERQRPRPGSCREATEGIVTVAIKKSDVSLAFMSLGIAVVAFLFFVVATLAVDKFIRKSLVPSFFGYSTLIVTTGSMSGTIEEGDLIVVKKADEYKIGDIVTFMPEGDTTPTTHRIIRIADGKFYTRGDANNAEDTRPITKDRIVGIVVDTYAHVGLFFTWLTDDFGWMYIVVAICIIVAGVLLLKSVSGGSKPTGDVLSRARSANATSEASIPSAAEESSTESSEKAPLSKGSCREATEGIVSESEESSPDQKGE